MISEQSVLDKTGTDHDELWHLFCSGCGFVDGVHFRARCGKTKTDWQIVTDGGVLNICNVCRDLSNLPKCPRCGYEPKGR